jgi:curved DNA-binding protein CbpA
VPNRDPQGFYSALNVSPEASAAEIRLAYVMLKQEYHGGRKQLDISRIRLAYQTLSHPGGRRAYDAGRPIGKLDDKKPITIEELKRLIATHSLPIAVGLLALGIVGLLALVGPELRASFVSYEAGDELYWVDHHRPLGTIESFEENHKFPTGATAPAYRIKPSEGGEPAWYPARDLERHARRR